MFTDPKGSVHLYIRTKFSLFIFWHLFLGLVYELRRWHADKNIFIVVTN